MSASRRFRHVAVLMGGWANEREVSLMSGNGVADALESRGYQVTRIDMDRQVAARIADAAPDVVFNAKLITRDGHEDLAITAECENGWFHAAFAT